MELKDLESIIREAEAIENKGRLDDDDYKTLSQLNRALYYETKVKATEIEILGEIDGNECIKEAFRIINSDVNNLENYIDNEKDFVLLKSKVGKVVDKFCEAAEIHAYALYNILNEENKSSQHTGVSEIIADMADCLKKENFAKVRGLYLLSKEILYSIPIDAQPDLKAVESAPIKGPNLNFKGSLNDAQPHVSNKTVQGSTYQSKGPVAPTLSGNTFSGDIEGALNDLKKAPSKKVEVSSSETISNENLIDAIKNLKKTAIYEKPISTNTNSLLSELKGKLNRIEDEGTTITEDRDISNFLTKEEVNDFVNNIYLPRLYFETESGKKIIDKPAKLSRLRLPLESEDSINYVRIELKKYETGNLLINKESHKAIRDNVNDLCSYLDYLSYNEKDMDKDLIKIGDKILNNLDASQGDYVGFKELTKLVRSEDVIKEENTVIHQIKTSVYSYFSNLSTFANGFKKFFEEYSFEEEDKRKDVIEGYTLLELIDNLKPGKEAFVQENISRYNKLFDKKHIDAVNNYIDKKDNKDDFMGLLEWINEDVLFAYPMILDNDNNFEISTNILIYLSVLKEKNGYFNFLSSRAEKVA